MNFETELRRRGPDGLWEASSCEYEGMKYDLNGVAPDDIITYARGAEWPSRLIPQV